MVNFKVGMDMYITMTIMGIGLIFMGTYCLRMTNQSDFGWLCCVLGVIITIVGVLLPIKAVIDGFIEEEFGEAIASIVVYVLALIGEVFFIKSLW